jgi:glycosyltransferase 2 family protein
VVAFATVLFDRILGLLALFLVGAATTILPRGIPENSDLRLATLLLWCGAGGGIVGLGFMLIPATTRWRWVNLLPRLPVIGHILGELIEGVKLYQSKPRAVIAALGLSLLGHAGLITGFYFCALWMRQPWVPDLVGHFYFLPTAELFSVLMPLPGGTGALEEAVRWFYAQLRPLSVSEEDALVAGTLAGFAYRLVDLIIAAAGGIYYLASRREIDAAMSEASTPDTPDAITANS